MTGTLTRERATLPAFLLLTFGITWVVWVPRALESAGVLDSRWASGLGAGWTYGPATTVVESCGANGDLTDTAAANSFDCTFPDGPATSTVSVTADDHDPANNTGSASKSVTA